MMNNRLIKIYRTLKEAIAGSDMDYSRGPLNKAILFLAIPTVLEMVMESIFVVVDILYVSRLGFNAVSIVGITESLITIIVAIALGLSTATSAIISRRIGERKPRIAAISAFQGIIAGLSISIIIGIPCIIYSQEILMMMGISLENAIMGKGYTAWMLGGNVVLVMLFINNAIFRSAGNAAIAMRVLWLANILNIILVPIFMFGLNMGVVGAGIGTVMGRGIGVIYQFYLLHKGSQRIKITVKEMVWFAPAFKKILVLAFGATSQNLIITISWVALMRIMSHLGSSVVAGYTIAIRIIIFVILPSWGLSNATSTLVGQSLGANNPARAAKAAWIIGLVNVTLMLIISVAILINPAFYIRLFIDDASVIAYGSEALRIITYGLVFYSFGMIMVQAINGAGDTLTPVWINIICFWIIEIPLSYLLAIQFNYAEQGVFWAILISESLLTIMATIIFARGKWKLKEI